MRYCARCLYPENAKPTIIFDDDDGICSGCKYHESRQNLEIDWVKREQIFRQLLSEARAEAQKRGNIYDCIIPVSGGKDSHYQVYLLKEKYGMNPLLVTFNHIFNTKSGVKNLENLVAKSGCDLVRVTANPKSVKKIARFMLETVGDITWHYHAGIRTVPFQVAVEKNIPLIVWGEHGFAELTGVVSLEDFVEFTKWTRKEHDMRGYEPEDLIKKSGGTISLQDLAPYVYPSDEAIERTGVKGIYISNFFYWDAKQHAEKMIEKWGFGTISYKRERSFNLYSKIEDHANDVHDYLKYLKFGYGRATDDASMEIRHGRMSREQGVPLVEQYDHVEPETLETYLDFLDLTKEAFYQMVEPMRDQLIWEKKNNQWQVKDSIIHHLKTEYTEPARLELVSDRTFSKNNKSLYYNVENPPEKIGDSAFDMFDPQFMIL
ncbi:MAG: N-acetyl sugar amidotransferase [Desulfobacteraceae bacterium]|nr:N-acetyl sugar amidotransferase [Desulfobacteraceae bacterium]